MATMQDNPAAVSGMMVVLNTIADKIELASVLNELGIK